MHYSYGLGVMISFIAVIERKEELSEIDSARKGRYQKLLKRFKREKRLDLPPSFDAELHI
jgi:hypothetical protein